MNCKIEGCSKRSRKLEMCVMHYYRVRKHGDPHYSYFSQEEVIKRFWLHVDKTPGFGPWGNCWRFTGKLNEDGYGQHSAGGPRWEIMAHRFSFWCSHGDIPAGLMVLHNCDMPACVNPSHLRLGTQVDNMKDRYSRGRSIKGEGNSMAKLTDRAVREIRRRAAIGEMSSVMARDYGVTLPVISRVRSGKGWTHVQ